MSNILIAAVTVWAGAVTGLDRDVFAFGHNVIPVEFEVEDQTPTGKFTTAAEVGKIVEMTTPSWIAVREWEGQDLLYFTNLLSWRCGMHQIRYAINGGEMQVYDMPPCYSDTASPNAIKTEDGLPYTTHAIGSVENIEVEVLLDDMRVLSATFERAEVLMP